MKYNNLGKSGLRVSEISFGSWLTFGGALDQKGVRNFMKYAVDHGVNFFDTAEVYAKGEAETLMGTALKDFRREDLVIASKICWGGNGPNDSGLSWKHIVEGTRNSLKRMKLTYLDIVFCHRPDLQTPIEETVRAMDLIVRAGYTFYWGTSEWSAEQLETAYKVCAELNCIPPITEQPEYNLFHRTRVEKEYKDLYTKYGLGLTTWSPLASGILTGKYNNLIPAGSRLEENDWLKKDLTADKIEKVKKLKLIADDLNCTLAQLSIAWCMKNPRVSTVLTGATRQSQLEENLQAINVKDSLNAEVMRKIDAIFGFDEG